MKLFGHPMSTCTRKVLALLAEKGQEAEFVLVDIMKGEGKQPAHLARQPFGQIPAIDDDGFVLYESRAIIRYLDERLPGPSLTPKDLKARALMEQWISVETSNFTPSAMKIVYQLFFGPMRGQQPDAKIVEEGRAGVTRALAILDAQLAKTKFLVGDAFTLADIAYMPYIEYVVAAKQGDLIAAHPNLARWWESIRSRPSWKKAIGTATATAKA